MISELLSTAAGAVLWVLVTCRALRSHAFTSLWWSGVAFAIALTLRVEHVADLLEAFLGGQTVAGLTHLALVAGVGLTARWLLIVHYGAATPPYWRTLVVVFVLAAGVMTGLMIASNPIALTPHAGGVPQLVANALFAACLLIACTVIAASATAAFTLAQLRYRLSLGCIGVAAVGLWLYAALSCYLAATATSASWPKPPAVATDTVLTVALLLITTAHALPLLLPRPLHRHDITTVRTLTALWGWLCPQQPPLAIDEQTTLGGQGVSDAASALLDRIWRLQHWVNPQQFATATATARAQGLTPRHASLVGVVNCLEEALRAERGGRSTERRVAELLPTTGSGRLDAELNWLTDLAETRGMPGSHRSGSRANNRPVTPAIPALADPDLLIRCEQLLEQWLPGQRPATVQAIVDVISRKLGRRIHIVIGDAEGLPLPMAVWVSMPDKHLIWVNAHTTPMQRTIGLLHEIGHIICGHTPTPIATTHPNLQRQLTSSVAALTTAPDGPALGYRGRDLGHGHGGCAADDRTEAEAELTGRLLAAHLLNAPDAALAAYLDEG